MPPTQCRYEDASIASTDAAIVDAQREQPGSSPQNQENVASPSQTGSYVDPSAAVYASSPPQQYFDYAQPLLINTNQFAVSPQYHHQMGGYYCTAPMYIQNNGTPMLVSGSPMMFSASPVSAAMYQSSPASTATASPVPFLHPHQQELSTTPPCSVPFLHPHQQEVSTTPPCSSGGASDLSLSSSSPSSSTPVAVVPTVITAQTPPQTMHQNFQQQQQQQQQQPEYMYPPVPQYVPMGSYPPLMMNGQQQAPMGSPPNNESYVVSAARQLERLSISNAPMYKPAPSQNLSQPNMAEIWHEEFQKNFLKYQDPWVLEPRPDGVTSEEVHGIFEDTAKIRFVCKNCHHAWTSMQGKVKFWYHKNDNNEGTVYFKLFGQMCRDCMEKRQCKEVQDALWYPDEIVKVVYNVHCKIGMDYYNLQQPRLMIQRRVGRPKGQHDAKLCSACQQGICRRNNVRC